MKTLLLRRILSTVAMTTMMCAAMFAQSSQTIKGTVYDDKTNNIIPFANISIKGTNIGTISNSDGEFTLNINGNLQNREIEISHLGYNNANFAINTATGAKYRLIPHDVSLAEIVVRYADPKQIILEAISRVDKNYIDKPSSMKAFYREAIKQRRDYVSISEAVADIYKTSYTNTGNDRVRIVKSRKGQNVKKADTLLFKLQGGPTIQLYLDVVKYPESIFCKEALKDYEYAYKAPVIIDNQLNYTISFKPISSAPYPLFNGTIYISQETLALTMIEFSLDLTDKYEAEKFFIKKKPSGLKILPSSTAYLAKYKTMSNGRSYISYMRNELAFKADWKKRWFSTSYSIVAEMAITDVNTENVEKIPYAESFKTSMVLNDRIRDLKDNNFWGDHNIIEPEKTIQNAIKKIAKHMQRNNE